MSDLSYTTGIQHDIHGNPMAMFSTSKGVWRIPVEVATHIALADEARHARIRELEAKMQSIQNAFPTADQCEARDDEGWRCGLPEGHLGNHYANYTYRATWPNGHRQSFRVLPEEDVRE